MPIYGLRGRVIRGCEVEEVVMRALVVFDNGYITVIFCCWNLFIVVAFFFLFLWYRKVVLKAALLRNYLLILIYIYKKKSIHMTKNAKKRYRFSYKTRMKIRIHY